MATQVFSAEEIASASQRLVGQPPEAILRWAVERFHPRLTMATAFGAEGCCLIHMLAEIEPGVRIFNLETGYQFAETLELRERIKQRYGIEVEYIRPELTVAEYEAEHGGPLYGTGPTSAATTARSCRCAGRSPATTPGSAPSAATRPPHRAAAGVVQWDAKFELVKVNPLLSVDQAATSGPSSSSTTCPTTRCTIRAIRASAAGPARSRWPTARTNAPAAGRGQVKKECGLHVIEHQGGSGI